MTPAYLPQERSSKGDILVVEDTPASLQLLTGLLSEAGYRVRPAPDGELALWSARGQPPELILLDIRMPGMDGYEVCRLLKDDARLRDVPVIFLSAFARVRQCALTLALELPPLKVAADRIQLQQVMINLILNGMDAMAERPAGARRMVISAGVVDGAAQVLVRDHGSGFQCELGRVFESFFTTKPTGMGLGLSIAAAIVREHGGRIWADNCADGGAVVGFQLPLEVLAEDGAP